MTRASRRRVHWLAASLIMVAELAAAGGTYSATRDSSRALPGVISAVRAAQEGRPIPAHLSPPLATIKLFPPRYSVNGACLLHRETRVAPILHCRAGDVASTRVIALFGDSHAFMWLPALLTMARRDHWAVVPFLRFGCTPEKWFTHRGPNGPICRAWVRWAMGQIEQLHPTVTLVSGSVGELPTSQSLAAAAGLVTAASRLKPNGRVVVIADPGGVAENAPRCITAPNATMKTCTTSWPPSVLIPYDNVERGAKSVGAGFMPTSGFVCYRRQCPDVVGHIIVWIDTNHITWRYSLELAAPFRTAFLRAMP